MNKIDITTIGQRNWNIDELFGHLRQNSIAWCWGAKNWTKYKDLVLKFKVQGYLHKGYVYISLGWDDTFNIHIVSTHGNIKKEYTGIYIDNLIDVIDRAVETK